MSNKTSVPTVTIPLRNASWGGEVVITPTQIIVAFHGAVKRPIDIELRAVLKAVRENRRFETPSIGMVFNSPDHSGRLIPHTHHGLVDIHIRPCASNGNDLAVVSRTEFLRALEFVRSSSQEPPKRS